jgi:small ligand-binding sensory domain FIST
MRWVSALSEAAALGTALAEVCAQVERALLAAPDLLLVFCTPHYAGEWSALPAALQARFPGAALIGASGGGVIGDGHEVEQRRGLALVAARLPGVGCHAFVLPPTGWQRDDDALAGPGEDEQADAEARAEAWRALVDLPESDLAPRLMVLLTEPFGGEADTLVAELQAAFPGLPIAGAIAGGAPFAGGAVLFCGDEAVPIGAVGLILSGALSAEVVVAHGCRAIGPPLLIGAAAGGVVRALDGRAPREVLRDLYESLDAHDRALFRRGLFVALEAEPEQVQHRDGAWYVRPIVGIDADHGGLTLGVDVRPWQVLQFVVRDARAAHDELAERLGRARAALRPDAALLLTCMGRGVQFFGRQDHDADLCRERLGPVPLGGLFSAGEIGPVGRRAFVHTVASVVVLLGEATAAVAPR